MAKGMGHVVIRHVSVIVCFHRKRRVNAAQLLHGKDPGYQNLLWFWIKSSQTGELFSCRLHGCYRFCPPGTAVLPVRLPTGFCRFIDQLHQITAQGFQLFHSVSAIRQTGIRRKRGGIVIDAAVDGV